MEITSNKPQISIGYISRRISTYILYILNQYIQDQQINFSYSKEGKIEKIKILLSEMNSSLNKLKKLIKIYHKTSNLNILDKKSAFAFHFNSILSSFKFNISEIFNYNNRFRLPSLYTNEAIDYLSYSKLSCLSSKFKYEVVMTLRNMIIERNQVTNENMNFLYSQYNGYSQCSIDNNRYSIITKINLKSNIINANLYFSQFTLNEGYSYSFLSSKPLSDVDSYLKFSVDDKISFYFNLFSYYKEGEIVMTYNLKSIQSEISTIDNGFIGNLKNYVSAKIINSLYIYQKDIVDNTDDPLKLIQLRSIIKESIELFFPSLILQSIISLYNTTLIRSDTELNSLRIVKEGKENNTISIESQLKFNRKFKLLLKTGLSLKKINNQAISEISFGEMYLNTQYNNLSMNGLVYNRVFHIRLSNYIDFYNSFHRLIHDEFRIFKNNLIFDITSYIKRSIFINSISKLNNNHQFLINIHSSLDLPNTSNSDLINVSIPGQSSYIFSITPNYNDERIEIIDSNEIFPHPVRTYIENIITKDFLTKSFMNKSTLSIIENIVIHHYLLYQLKLCNSSPLEISIDKGQFEVKVNLSIKNSSTFNRLFLVVGGRLYKNNPNLNREKSSFEGHKKENNYLNVNNIDQYEESFVDCEILYCKVYQKKINEDNETSIIDNSMTEIELFDYIKYSQNVSNISTTKEFDYKSIKGISKIIYIIMLFKSENQNFFNYIINETVSKITYSNQTTDNSNQTNNFNETFNLNEDNLNIEIKNISKYLNQESIHYDLSDEVIKSIDKIIITSQNIMKFKIYFNKNNLYKLFGYNESSTDSSNSNFIPFTDFIISESFLDFIFQYSTNENLLTFIFLTRGNNSSRYFNNANTIRKFFLGTLPFYLKFLHLFSQNINSNTILPFLNSFKTPIQNTNFFFSPLGIQFNINLSSQFNSKQNDGIASNKLVKYFFYPDNKQRFFSKLLIYPPLIYHYSHFYTEVLNRECDLLVYSLNKHVLLNRLKKVVVLGFLFEASLFGLDFLTNEEYKINITDLYTITINICIKQSSRAVKEFDIVTCLVSNHDESEISVGLYFNKDNYFFESLLMKNHDEIGFDEKNMIMTICLNDIKKGVELYINVLKDVKNIK